MIAPPAQIAQTAAAPVLTPDRTWNAAVTVIDHLRDARVSITWPGTPVAAAAFTVTGDPHRDNRTVCHATPPVEAALRAVLNGLICARYGNGDRLEES